MAGLVLLRRKRGGDAIVFEPPQATASPPASPQPVAEPAPTRARAEPSLPSLTIDLIAARMSASLVNATLSYRLRLSARTDLADLQVVGGMTSAHASRPDNELLGIGDAPKLHSVGAIAAGGIVELSGEVRLPLAEITPIRHGSSALFVPLVRLEVSGRADGQQFTARAAFVVGIEDTAASERLQPFRLDLGPRIYPQVGQRELTVPAFA
ncbi:hypothetical protein [Novosphingobium jiangmenense]|uniref:AsmA-like C-terminal domain-containing protein n=1 Tax=Novosphingobium jiangmenense TaxID=2791981 RepID=A0ABS0HIL2_9SPHN|nr:hypothetical protein [Novosphingobium jiangmenense]MBF9151821.1 hypothetical protein [Novosphingobium jiangmenense]